MAFFLLRASQDGCSWVSPLDVAFLAFLLETKCLVLLAAFSFPGENATSISPCVLTIEKHCTTLELCKYIRTATCICSDLPSFLARC